MTLRRATPPTYGPGGAETGGSVEDVPVRVLFVDIRSAEAMGLVVQSQRNALIAADMGEYGEAPPPDENDALIDPWGAEHVISGVKTLDFGEGAPAYLCSLAGG